MRHDWLMKGSLLCVLMLAPSAARADLILSYDVDILQSGTINIGDTINWQIVARIAGTPNTGANFGIASLSVNLRESLSETLAPGAVGSEFTAGGYVNTSGGTPTPGGLNFVSVFASSQGPQTVGNAPGSYLLASGQYVATQAGVHTLQAMVAGADPSQYFSQPGQSTFLAPSYDSVSFGSDSITVAAVPEPTSLAFASVAAVGAWIFRRRKL